MGDDLLCGTPRSRRQRHEPVIAGLRPNKRLKLTGPAFRGSVRLCAGDLVPQDGVLAPAGARPAA